VRHDIPARRSILAAVGAAFGAFAIGAKTAAAQGPAASGPFQPARHHEDEWLNTVPGRHRTFIDCATVSGAGEALLYANNLYVANKSGYQLNESDVAVVVCLRHQATPFAYNDAIWAKYGKALSEMLSFTDPKTKQAPATNLFNVADYGPALPNMGNSIPSVVQRGTQFAVCNMATRMLSGRVAGMVKADADAVYKEFASNLIPNSHLVAAGVVAVNRAQEYGYTLLTAL
jgi:hypothetical protein